MKGKVVATSLWLFVVVACVLLLPMRYGGRVAFAQFPIPPELACPSGYQPMAGGQTYNPSTGKFRQVICVDGSGHVFMQPDAVAGAIPGFTGIFTPGHVVTVSGASPPVFQDGGPAPGVSSQVSAATAFNLTLSGQVIIASAPSATPVFVTLTPIANSVGSCGANTGTDTVTPFLNYTDSNTGSLVTLTGASLSDSISGGQGVLTTSGHFISGASSKAWEFLVVPQAGTAITYGTNQSSPVSCTTQPTYVVFAKAVF